MYYSILMDAETGTYYMEPGNVAFYVYSDIALFDLRKPNVRLVTTDIEDIKELETKLYNAGFFRGFIDGKAYNISKQNIYYYDRNPNEICYAQYLLTKDRNYLNQIRKPQLYTLCKLDGNSIYFPTTQVGDEKFVLTYTDRKRMPKALLDKYDGWRSVYMTFNTRCIVNESFVAE